MLRGGRRSAEPPRGLLVVKARARCRARRPLRLPRGRLAAGSGASDSAADAGARDRALPLPSNTFAGRREPLSGRLCRQHRRGRSSTARAAAPRLGGLGGPFQSAARMAHDLSNPCAPLRDTSAGQIGAATGRRERGEFCVRSCARACSVCSSCVVAADGPMGWAIAKTNTTTICCEYECDYYSGCHLQFLL